MSQSTLFCSQILESGAAAYAGLAASLLLERHPEIEQRLSPSALRHWKAHLKHQVLDLSAAMAVEEPGLFASRLRWHDRALRARNAESRDLAAALECLREVLYEELPESARDQVAAFFDTAATATAAARRDERRVLDPADPKGRLALAYVEAVLAGDSRRALDLVVAAGADGMSVRELYLDVLLAAQRQVGEMWHLGEVGVAEEHLVTTTTERAMAVLVQRADRAPAHGKTVITAAVAGNNHGLGIRALADFLELAGWRSICLGADVPVAELAKAAVAFEADLVGLSAALATHLKPLRESIEVLRRPADRELKILVGGGAFAASPDLWQRLGADGYAPSADAAVAAAAGLVGRVEK